MRISDWSSDVCSSDLMTTTLFIGLDGCTFTVLDQMISDLPGEGVTMPFIKSLMEKGVRAKLRSTPNPLTPPAWTSIMTGKGPGEHGVFEFIRAEEDRKSTRLNSSH